MNNNNININKILHRKKIKISPVRWTPCFVAPIWRSYCNNNNNNTKLFLMPATSRDFRVAILSSIVRSSSSPRFPTFHNEPLINQQGPFESATKCGPRIGDYDYSERTWASPFPKVFTMFLASRGAFFFDSGCSPKRKDTKNGTLEKNVLRCWNE